jgi:threonyl-tRNA synthetase
VQAVLIPIADRHVAYSESVAEQLRAGGLRLEVDASSDRMQAKIRDAQMQKIPYMLIVGDREMAAAQVNLRTRDGNVFGAMSVDEFASLAHEAVSERRPI